jgi:hypothetical protein
MFGHAKYYVFSHLQGLADTIFQLGSLLRISITMCGNRIQ